MLLDVDFNSGPDFINGHDVKWWLVKTLTEYANEERPGVLPLNAYVYVVETKDKRRSFLLIKDNKILGEALTIETIACKIDILRVARTFH